MGLIALKNGTKIESSVLAESPSDRSILLTIPKKDIVECAVLFGNPENTERIVYTAGYFETTYIGYTSLVSITDDSDANSTLIRLGVGELQSGEKTIDYAVPEEYVPESLRLPKDQ